jgi:hypothetical protein
MLFISPEILTLSSSRFLLLLACLLVRGNLILFLLRLIVCLLLLLVSQSLPRGPQLAKARARPSRLVTSSFPHISLQLIR